MAVSRRAGVDRLAGWLQERWLSKSTATRWLSPLAFAYGGAVAARRQLFARGILSASRVPAKVVVVGNIVAGGAGKTPAVIAVAAILRDAGFTPGIVSRGFGRVVSDRGRIVAVEPGSDPAHAGDEPVLLRRRTGVPVFVGADRVAAAHALLQAHPQIDAIVSDDGLQHLALERDVEVVVFDERGVGNGLLLPAGPLREPFGAAAATTPARSGGATPPQRIVLYNALAATTALPGFVSTRCLAGAASLGDWHRGEAPSLATLHALRGRRIVAAAAIARPNRFFDALRSAGLAIDELTLPDHHDYAALPWPSTAGDVVVTEKDAVKLSPERKLSARVWVAALDFAPEPGFAAALVDALRDAPTLESEPPSDFEDTIPRTDGNTPA